jgi:hypothetical protein
MDQMMQTDAMLEDGEPIDEVALAEEQATKAKEERKALVTKLCKEIGERRDALEKKQFARMRADMRFTANRSGEQWSIGESPGDEDKYVANITHRHIQQKTADLYARNPQYVVKRKPRLDFAIWDGKSQSLQMAMMAQQTAMAVSQTLLATTGVMAPPQIPPDVAALLADIQQGMQRKQMLNRVGKTGEMLMKYFADEQSPRMKVQLKQAVRRALTVGIAYKRLDYQRVTGPNPVSSTRIDDMAQQIERLNRLIAEAQEHGGACEPEQAELAELTAMKAAFENEPEIILREGPVTDFPDATCVIPCKDTKQLIGWIGTQWIAVQTVMSADRVQEVFGVDLMKEGETKQYTRYSRSSGAPTAGATGGRAGDDDDMACVWLMYDRRSGMGYWLCDGYEDFLREPAPPNVRVEGFFPIWALAFNEVESQDDPFPPSDVQLMKHQQKEYNRQREALRQHRIANQPHYVTSLHEFSQEDEDKLRVRVPHGVTKLDGLGEGQKIADVLQAAPVAPLDPSLYDTGPVFQDTQYVVGSQESAFGGLSDSTATEATIANQSQSKTTSANSDDLDEFLSAAGRAEFSVLLQELDEATVKDIVGPGAVWPQMSRAEIEKELYLELIAGSSGRPDQARQIAQLERAAPFILQIPGINPEWLARKAVTTIDPDADLEEAMLEGAPSIQAANALMKPSAGGPPMGENSSDPAAQGPAGADNAPAPPAGAPGAQPAFPSGNPMGAAM